MRLIGVVVLALALGLAYAADKELSLPVVLPPYQDASLSGAASDWNSCLLYMEAITITVFPINKDAKPRGASATISSANATTKNPHQYVWNEDYAHCLKNLTKNNENKEEKSQAERQNFEYVYFAFALRDLIVVEGYKMQQILLSLSRFVFQFHNRLKAGQSGHGAKSR